MLARHCAAPVHVLAAPRCFLIPHGVLCMVAAGADPELKPDAEYPAWLWDNLVRAAVACAVLVPHCVLGACALRDVG